MCSSLNTHLAKTVCQWGGRGTKAHVQLYSMLASSSHMVVVHCLLECLSESNVFAEEIGSDRQGIVNMSGVGTDKASKSTQGQEDWISSMFMVEKGPCGVVCGARHTIVDDLGRQRRSWGVGLVFSGVVAGRDYGRCGVVEDNNFWAGRGMGNCRFLSKHKILVLVKDDVVGDANLFE